MKAYIQWFHRPTADGSIQNLRFSSRAEDAVDWSTGEEAHCAECQAKGRGGDRRRSSTQRGYEYRRQKTGAAFSPAHSIAVDWFSDRNGVVKLAEVVDHIRSNRGDMKLLWDLNNWQGLTKADHDRNSALEDGGFGH